ncbi:MAG: LysR family transcriptional regulator, partial [Gammaproteobacteria bacterium]|nr:LysR family transcriptional regulator [Gammaproteobacteria bacterium]MBU1556612.1 LysR family transcriptional regulator [Gammaproteobacteria bacterium]
MLKQADLNNLQLVQRLAQAGSFTAAAEQLGCSKTTISLQLKALEQQLGTALFRRTTRQLSLTRAGEQLLQNCMPLLEQLQQALQNVQSGDKVLQGKLVVSAPEDYTNRKLAPAAVAFRQLHPALEFEFRSSDQVKDAVKEN